MRMTDEFRAALDRIFSIWPKVDLAFSLPGGAWVRPDATAKPGTGKPAGQHRRLGGIDRLGVEALSSELWKRALSGGQGIHWRPACSDWRAETAATDTAGTDAAGYAAGYAAYVLVDDCDGPTVLRIIGKYQAAGIETSTDNYQAVIATTRALTRLEQHDVQTALVRRLLADGRRADPGAVGAGQFSRLPGFPHPHHAGRVVGFLGSSSGSLPLPLLDPDAVLRDEIDPPMAAKAAPSGRQQASPRRPRPKAAGSAASKSQSQIEYGECCKKIRAGADLVAWVEQMWPGVVAREKRQNEADARKYLERMITSATEDCRRSTQ